MTGRLRWAICTGCLVVSGVTHAQLPLSIDELLVEERVTKLQGSVSFSNQDRVVLTVPPGPGQRAVLAPSNTQQQGTVSTVRLRHGLARQLEVHLGANASRLSGDRQPDRDTWDLSLGANWLVSPDTRTPALLLQGSVDLLGRGALPGATREWGRSLRLGATLYRAIDPLVLSVAAQYQHQLAQRTALGDYRPGSQWVLRPQVNFAVNYRVTLVGGVTLQHRGRDRLAEQTLAGASYLSALNLGLGLLVGERSTLFADTQITTSGGDGASLSFEWLYRF
ncbi:hypothetical protein [Haliea atlantica]